MPASRRLRLALELGLVALVVTLAAYGVSAGLRAMTSGDVPADSAEAKSIVPLSMTTRPGRNFNVDGLGVCSVWINKPTSLSSRAGFIAAPLRLGTGRHRSHSIVET